MVRSALTPPRRIGQGPSRLAAYVPSVTVVAASFLAVLPIISTSGWYPDFGYLVFISWRLLRADPWPAWWAAPLGFVNDLFTGYPIGFSIALWSATMLALDLIEPERCRQAWLWQMMPQRTVPKTSHQWARAGSTWAPGSIHGWDSRRRM